MIKKDALIIRKLNISDASVVQRLIDEIFSAPPWNDDWKAEELRAYTAELLGGGTALCFGLFDRTELAGIALGRTKTWWEGKEYVLEEFGIVENLRGKRTGAYFMAEVERLAAARSGKDGRTTRKTEPKGAPAKRSGNNSEITAAKRLPGKARWRSARFLREHACEMSAKF